MTMEPTPSFEAAVNELANACLADVHGVAAACAITERRVYDPLWGYGITVSTVKWPPDMTMVRIDNGGYLVALPTKRLRRVSRNRKGWR